MKILILASLLTLAACSPSYEDKTGKYTQMPEEMKHCKVFNISDGDASQRVFYCPNAQTTIKYNCGKNCTRTNTVISE